MNVPNVDTDECVKCGEDLTIDRRTEIDELHEARKKARLMEHYREEHRVIWTIAYAAARVIVAVENTWKRLRQ